MRAFSSFGALAAQMRIALAELPSAEKHGLEEGAKIIAAEARAEIGHYQDAAGPFAAWPELADRTKADRLSAGFPENNPLLRSGELLHSIEHQVEGRKAVIGSTSEIAAYQELGTPNARYPIPPRSFLGHAAFVKGKDAAHAIGKAVANVIAGRPP